jgi:predicted DNA-binding transcriptional regulator AlpA
VTERVVVATVSELEEMIGAVVRKVLDEREGLDAESGELTEELTTKEVMKLLNVRSQKTLWAWRREQGFPAPRSFGKNSVRYLRRDVEAWRAARRASGPGAVKEPGSTERRTRRTRPANSH